MFLRVVVCFSFILCLNGDKFPSLLTTNSTIAIVIDREFMAEDYANLKATIENYMVYAKREILKHGGINVQYFSWARINIKRDITAIISVASCEDTWQLFNAAEDEHLLHMAISESDCPRLPQNQAITVPIISKGEEMPQLVLDLRVIAAYKWKSVVLLYDDTLERDMITRVISSFTSESPDLKISGASLSLISLETTIKATDSRSIIHKKLSQINPDLMGSNFLAIVSSKMSALVMEVAKSLHLVNTNSQWIYMISNTNWKNSDITHLQKLVKEGDNIAFIYNTTISDTKCMSGVPCHAEEILQAFTKSLDIAIVAESNLANQVSDEEWEAIRPSKLERRDTLLEYVKNHLKTDGVCDNCIMWNLKAAETWGKEYQKNASQSDELLNVGTWKPSNGPNLEEQIFPHVAHGFRKKNLPLVSFHNPPWQILEFNEAGALINHGGLIFDIIKELSARLNFTYTIEVLKFDSSVMRRKDSTYSNGTKIDEPDLGMTPILTNLLPDAIIRLTKDKKIAIAACAFTIVEEYKNIVNYTSPISIQTYALLASRPRELSKALLFMAPFTFHTWLCLAASVIVMGPCLYLIHKYSPVYLFKGYPMLSGLSSAQSCTWYMYGALLQQGGMHLPYADSARIIVGTWWLVVLVVATTYCGNLVAFLTFPKIDIPITTLSDLLAHKDSVTWSTTKGCYFEKLIKSSEDSKYLALYRGMMKTNINPNAMMGDIEKGKHVRFDWKTKLDYYMKKQYLETDRCQLALGSEEFFNERLAMIMAQDAPYLKLINNEIKKLHQVGLIERWLKAYLPKKDRCFKVGRVTEVTNHTVNLDDMQGSFFVLVIGFALALFLLLFERVMMYYTNNHNHLIAPYTS